MHNVIIFLTHRVLNKIYIIMGLLEIRRHDVHDELDFYACSNFKKHFA